MSHNVADSTLNLSAQSLALLALLADTELHYDLRSETGAFYNGRERGVWLQVGKIGYQGRAQTELSRVKF